MPFNTNNKIQLVDGSGDAVILGAGDVTTETLRVTLAGDDPAVAKLGTIDTDTGNIATILTAIDSDTSNLPSIKTAVQKIDNVIYDDDSAFTLGSSDIVAIGGFAGTQTITSNQIGALSCTTGGALYTTHDITGGADGVKVVTTAGAHVELASSTACKKVDIQAQTDNTGIIAVGFDNVDATVATGTGIILNAGDIYSLEINNLNLIYIDSTEDGEGVRYTYFT